MPNYTKTYGTKRFKESKNGKRFLTSLDMAEAKLAESIYNSHVKRGILDRKHTDITVFECGCIICSDRGPSEPRLEESKINTISIDELRGKLK